MHPLVPIQAHLPAQEGDLKLLKESNVVDTTSSSEDSDSTEENDDGSGGRTENGIELFVEEPATAFEQVETSVISKHQFSS